MSWWRIISVSPGTPRSAAPRLDVRNAPCPAGSVSLRAVAARRRSVIRSAESPACPARAAGVRGVSMSSSRRSSSTTARSTWEWQKPATRSKSASPSAFATERVSGRRAAQDWKRRERARRLRSAKSAGRRRGRPPDSAVSLTGDRAPGGHETLGGLANHAREGRLARAGGDRGNRARKDVLEPGGGAVDAELGDRRRAAEAFVLANGLAEAFLGSESVAQVVGDLEGLSDTRAEFFPWLGRLAGGDRSHLGGGHEEGARLRAVVGGEFEGAGRIVGPGAGDGVERENDEAVASEHRERFAVGAVDRRLAAADRGVVECRQVVVDERGAVHELERRGRRGGEARPVVAAGHGDGEEDGGADARAARGDRVVQRGGELRRRRLGLPGPDGA